MACRRTKSALLTLLLFPLIGLSQTWQPITDEAQLTELFSDTYFETTLTQARIDEMDAGGLWPNDHLIDRFLDGVAAHPDQPLLVEADATTTWEEIDVGCEACHGPGADHVRWATEGGETDDAFGFPVALRPDLEARWVREEGVATAQRIPPVESRPEIDVCGRCHSRRTALVDTGSRMDEVIFQEFKGTGNTEIVMDRKLFERRIFPCIDISASGTRKEEKLFTVDEYQKVMLLRRALARLSAAEAMQLLTERLARYPDNAAFLADQLSGLKRER